MKTELHCYSRDSVPGPRHRSTAAMPKKVCIVGSGNWGSAIARLVGYNADRLPERFQRQVNMWVFEEEVEGRKLTEIINTDHENVKYLPGRPLPHNVVAVPDIETAAADADYLIFVLPHQFIKRACAPLVGKLKPGAAGLSLVKVGHTGGIFVLWLGQTVRSRSVTRRNAFRCQIYSFQILIQGFAILPGGGIKLISKLISEEMRLPVSVLMGANLANEVADEKFCETTIGAEDPVVGSDLKLLFQTDNFRVTVVADAEIVEICGALKNIVACAAGFCDGMKSGDNTKAAIIRLGLKEMMKYGDTFYPGGNHSTYFESCGVADLITTCYGGRNRKVSQVRFFSIINIQSFPNYLCPGLCDDAEVIK